MYSRCVHSLYASRHLAIPRRARDPPYSFIFVIIGDLLTFPIRLGPANRNDDSTNGLRTSFGLQQARLTANSTINGDARARASVPDRAATCARDCPGTALRPREKQLAAAGGVWEHRCDRRFVSQSTSGTGARKYGQNWTNPCWTSPAHLRRKRLKIKTMRRGRGGEDMGGESGNVRNGYGLWSEWVVNEARSC